MTKTPIDPADIRKGDLIRWERTEEAAGVDRAVEYRAPRDQHEQSGLTPRFGQHYLLDRPKPPVDLPTEPTLGWLTLRVGGFFSGPTMQPVLETVWLNNAGTGLLRAGRTDVLDTARIESFTPVTVVPTKALVNLRQHMDDAALDEFFTAIDEADA